MAEKDAKTNEPLEGEKKPTSLVSTLLTVAVVVGVLVGGFVMAGGQSGMKQGMEAAIHYVEAAGNNGMYLYLAITTIGVIGVVPTTPMELAGGFLFSTKYGWWVVWLLTSLAKFVGNIVSVLIARHLIKDWVRKNVIDRFELLKLVESAVAEEPYKMAFLVRGSLIPLSVKNYGLGVMDVGLIPIALGSCVFTPFYGLQHIVIGSACKNLKEVFAPKHGSDGPASWVDSLKTMLPIAFNVMLIFFIVKAVKSQINKKKAAIEKELREKHGDDKKKEK